MPNGRTPQVARPSASGTYSLSTTPLYVPPDKGGQSAAQPARGSGHGAAARVPLISPPFQGGMGEGRDCECKMISAK